MPSRVGPTTGGATRTQARARTGHRGVSLGAMSCHRHGRARTACGRDDATQLIANGQVAKS